MLCLICDHDTSLNLASEYQKANVSKKYFKRIFLHFASSAPDEVVEEEGWMNGKVEGRESGACWRGWLGWMEGSRNKDQL